MSSEGSEQQNYLLPEDDNEEDHDQEFEEEEEDENQAQQYALPTDEEHPAYPIQQTSELHINAD